MDITIRKPNGEGFAIENVKPSGIIKDVKAKIHDKMGYPMEQLRLICGGEQLEDDRTLSSYKIQKGTIIYISFKVSVFLQSL